MLLRSPILVVLGHVDHGKTTILDKIRGTAIAAAEPGLITQHVGASFIPTSVIEKRCSGILRRYNFSLRIPGLLVIDTPGHEAFVNLRKRGGSAADLAVLVIDVSQGIQPQTTESIEILKNYKTPFIVAANKIDLVEGWIKKENASFSESVSLQNDFARERLDEKVYSLVAELGKLGFDSERFDRVTDFTRQIAIIPVSAKSGEGIDELLMFMAGLAQKYMDKKLHINLDAPAEGVVLEVKEVQGLGMTIDAVIYEGKIKSGDKIAVASFDGPLITKVRALLQPAPLEEIRDPRKRFKNVEQVHAAAGVKISAPGLEKAIAGSPLIVAHDVEKAREKIMSELKSIKIEQKTVGVILKTDALGSLEAVAKLLAESGISIRRGDVGAITRFDLMEAETVKEENRYAGAIFAFNVATLPDLKLEAAARNIKIFESNIIYKLVEDYREWERVERKAEEEEKLEKYIYPAKLKILRNCIFRVSKPAVVGVEVLAGKIKAKYPLMNERGALIGQIQSIQEKNQTIKKAEAGMKVAISIDKGVVGRNIHEEDILFTSIPLEQIYEHGDEFENQEILAEIKKIKKEVHE